MADPTMAIIDAVRSHGDHILSPTLDGGLSNANTSISRMLGGGYSYTQGGLSERFESTLDGGVRSATTCISRLVDGSYRCTQGGSSQRLASTLGGGFNGTNTSITTMLNGGYSISH